MRSFALLAIALLAGTALAQNAGPTGPVALPPPPPPPAPVAVAPAAPTAEETAAVGQLEAARTQLKLASEASTAGNAAAAERAWREALRFAPLGNEGDVVAAEATRRLGFAAFEARDTRSAELWLRAEAGLSRRLYRMGTLPPRRYAEAINRLASAVGANGRIEDSAALLTLAQEVRSRAQASVSAAVMGRQGVDAAAQQDVRVNATAMSCMVDDVPDLARRLTCNEEVEVFYESLIAHAQRLKAEAPPLVPLKGDKKGKKK